ncbi:MAG: sulfatase-like hydrolase/transferase [Mariniblastus sp.]|nr:sulfatase-like hydrolase/transferase [Mariniblastus sp.]
MSQIELRNAVVLVIDGLGAESLGPYGNTWIETDNFNRLAARSLIFDQAYAPGGSLDQAYELFWGAEPHVKPESPRQTGQNLIRDVAELGALPTLITDETQVEALKVANSFDQVIPVQSTPANQLANANAETEMANFFAQATQWLSRMEPGSLGWLHSCGLMGAWDAPFDLRQKLADPEDPEPPRFHLPPSLRFDVENDEPDELLGFQQAFAAQVTILDQFLGIILDLMETDPVWSKTLFCLTSTGGYPMGEHGWIGHHQSKSAFYNEAVHVPLIICPPDHPDFDDALTQTRSVRNGSLVGIESVSDYLRDWFADDLENFCNRWDSSTLSLPEVRKEAVVLRSDDTYSIQTHAWKLIRRGDQFELFAKPDDRWEVNDVSRRCPQIVEALDELLRQMVASGTEVGGLGGSGGLELPESLAIRSE